MQSTLHTMRACSVGRNSYAGTGSAHVSSYIAASPDISTDRPTSGRLPSGTSQPDKWPGNRRS